MIFSFSLRDQQALKKAHQIWLAPEQVCLVDLHCVPCAAHLSTSIALLPLCQGQGRGGYIIAAASKLSGGFDRLDSMSTNCNGQHLLFVLAVSWWCCRRPRISCRRRRCCLFSAWQQGYAINIICSWYFTLISLFISVLLCHGIILFPQAYLLFVPEFVALS